MFIIPGIDVKTYLDFIRARMIIKAVTRRNALVKLNECESLNLSNCVYEKTKNLK